MAITAPRLTSDFSGFIQPNRAQAYFDEVRRRSVIQQLARQVPLGFAGEEISVTTSKPVAGWVAEGGQKPASQGGKTLVTMAPKKVAVIAVASEEVIRANPGGYVDDVRDDIAEAFAIAFDAAAFHGTNTPFAAHLAQTTKSVEIGTATQANGGIHGDMVAGMDLLLADGRKVNGFAFDESAETLFLGATDTTGRPLFVDTPDTSDSPLMAGRMLRRPTYFAEGVGAGTLVGFAGDWSKVIWGAVGGISYSVSDQATVTINGALVSLWENNLVAIRAEAEFGLVIDSVAHFTKFLDAV